MPAVSREAQAGSPPGWWAVALAPGKPPARERSPTTQPEQGDSEQIQPAIPSGDTPKPKNTVRVSTRTGRALCPSRTGLRLGRAARPLNILGRCIGRKLKDKPAVVSPRRFS